jgi:hypothetical protein
MGSYANLLYIEPAQIGLGMPTHSAAVAEAVPPSGD